MNPAGRRHHGAAAGRRATAIRGLCLGLLCGLSLGALAQDDAGYIPLGQPTEEPGTAPGLAVTDHGAVRRVVELRLRQGDELIAGLTDYVERERPPAGHLNGVGGFRSAVFSWYDPARRAFKRIVVDAKGEVVSFTGTVAYRDGKPQVHVHAVMSLDDGSTRGGHLVSAIVSPIMQVYVTETEK